MIKYTFYDPCQEKCKIAINQTLIYQNFKYYLISWLIYVNDIEESGVITITWTTPALLKLFYSWNIPQKVLDF
jgi:hypothetical protein